MNELLVMFVFVCVSLECHYEKQKSPYTKERNKDMNIDDIKNIAVIGAGNMGMEAFRETGDVSHFPSPSVVEKYVKGEYGQKTGKG